MIHIHSMRSRESRPHEIAWNEYGSWEFIIKDRLYTYVKPGSEYIQITPEKLDWKNPEIGKEQSMRV